MKQKAEPSVARCAFRRALAAGLPGVLPYLLALLLGFTVPTAWLVLGYDGRAAEMAAEPAPALRELYHYVLFDADEFGWTPLALLALLTPVVLGVVLFAFLVRKRSAGLYFSLGLTRRQLFCARYLAGVVLLAAATLLAAAVNLAVNLAYFGSCWQLWCAVACMFTGLMSQAVLGFSVTAAVFSCVGTLEEGVAHTLLLLAAPSLLLFGIEGMLGRFWGSPYGLLWDAEFGRGKPLSLPLQHQLLQPAFFLGESLNPAAQWETGKPWAAPSLLPLLLWALAAIAAAVAALLLFRRRKVEHCGFLGRSRALNLISLALLELVCFGTVYKLTALTDRISNAVAVLLGVLACTLVYCVFTVAITRDKRRFLKKLRWLPAHLGAAALLGVLTVATMGRLAGYVPESTQVQSADVILPEQTLLLSGSSWSRGIDSLQMQGQGGSITSFTSARDLQRIEALHRQLAAGGKLPLKAEGARESQVIHTTLQFVYRLKNGREVRRSYDRAPVSLLTQFLQLEDSDRYHALVRQVLTQAPAAEPKQGEYGLWSSQNQLSEARHVLLASKWLTSEQEVALTPAQRLELLRCISADLQAQPAVKRYFPSAPAAGTIAFLPEHRLNDSSRVLSGDLSALRLSLTPDMENTLGFLQRHNLTSLLQETARVRSLSVIRVQFPDVDSRMISGAFPYLSTSYCAQTFYGGWHSAGLQDEHEDFLRRGPELAAFENAPVLRDPAQITAVMQHAYLNYYLNTDGYYILAEFEQERGQTVFFVPEKEAPAALREAAADS
ncbi:MAG TPA: hypothetical protein IAD07_09860 [Candidatus Fimivicinus intestinavium]|nr:hypothetical protein [Candidatus Fimivicinus intestinavium]